MFGFDPVAVTLADFVEVLFRLMAVNDVPPEVTVLPYPREKYDDVFGIFGPKLAPCIIIRSSTNIRDVSLFITCTGIICVDVTTEVPITVYTFPSCIDTLFVKDPDADKTLNLFSGFTSVSIPVPFPSSI
jgi:hypothetical protein